MEAMAGMENRKSEALLEQLLPLQAEPDFDALFDRLTQGESANTRFLLKMEIKQKGSPCMRVMDMRSRYAAIPYIYAGIQHFLSLEDIEIFQQQLRIYHGRYTMGVYEAVMEAHRQRLNQESEVEDPQQPVTNKKFEVEGIPFASHYHRQAERMHFSSPIRLQLADGGNFPAKTSDISLNGLRVAMGSAISYEVGELCHVSFDGLMKEHPASIINRPIAYQILGEEVREDRYWLKLLRVDPDPELDQYLARFIDSNKGRYRISVDYLLSAAESKGYEQYYLPRLTGLPLFFGENEQQQLQLQHVLRTENNQHELEYWRNERNEEMLAGLFPPSRLNRIVSQPGSLKQTLIYCFTHTVRTHIYFFSATREELDESGLKQLFFTVGARRPSWRVYQFSLEAVTLDEAGLDRLLEDKQQQIHYEEVLRHNLMRIRHVGLLHGIEDESNRRDYLQEQITDRSPNELQIYGHPQQVPGFELELLHYTQLRKEPRYIHKTAVAVKFGGQTVVGWTRDISTQGLQFELEQPLGCEREDIIKLSLPKLQELSRSFKLQDLPYRVVNVNTTRTVLNLCIHGEQDSHQGRKFFNLLIESNSNKLKTAKELRRLRGMATALRNLFTHHLFNYPLYLSKARINRLGGLGYIKTPRSLQGLFTEQAETDMFNLFPLLKEPEIKDALLHPLRRLNREEKPLQFEIYIARSLNRQGEPVYETRLASSFAGYKERRQFVQKAQSGGSFYAIRVYLSRTGRPDVEFIANELDYIAKYAIHKARHLEETLWSVVGVCELVDTSSETCYRLGINK